MSSSIWQRMYWFVKERNLWNKTVCRLPQAPENLGAMRHSSLSYNYIWKKCLFLSTRPKGCKCWFIPAWDVNSILKRSAFHFPLPCDAHQWTVTSPFFRWGSNTSVSSSVNCEEIAYVPPKEFLRKISKFIHVKFLK